jgi:hypothetical protein
LFLAGEVGEDDRAARRRVREEAGQLEDRGGARGVVVRAKPNRVRVRINAPSVDMPK